jgi:hypothetical protein
MTITINGTTGISGVDGSSATPAMQGADTNTGISYGTDTVTINTGGVARVTTDASGNVGVGTDSPLSSLSVFKSSAGDQFYVDDGTSKFYFAPNGSGEGIIKLDTANAIRFLNAGGERARIDSSGNLLVGTTIVPTAGVDGISVKTAGQPIIRVSRNGTVSQDHMQFQNSNGIIGVISTSGTTTTYATSSDYRLKENVAPMQNALATVAALNPVTYTWKADGSAGQGFIAHELQAVVPDCVTGEKDAVEIVDDLDADGKKIGTKEVPRYQGVDTSFLVATLVAALQELKADFDAYKATRP